MATVVAHPVTRAAKPGAAATVADASQHEYYRTFERGTPAGEALYRLYNGKKKMDSTLDRDLLARLQAQRARQAEQAVPKPKVQPKSKARVTVPRSTHGYAYHNDIHACGWAGAPRAGKKLKKECDEQLRVREQEIAALPAPPRRHLGEDAKQQLQTLMEYNGELPPLPRTPQKPVLSRRQQKLDEIDGLKQEFSGLAKQLEQQREKLDVVTARPVVPKRAEAAIRRDVNDTVSQMREIDYLIKQEEALL